MLGKFPHFSVLKLAMSHMAYGMGLKLSWHKARVPLNPGRDRVDP